MEIFISHSQQDKPFVDALRASLVKQGFEVWNPDTAILPGTNWLSETGRALEHADAVVFVLSDKSKDSPHTARELEFAMTNRKYENRVVPVRLGRSVKVPWILKGSVVEAAEGDPASAARRIGIKLRMAARSRARQRMKERLRQRAGSRKLLLTNPKETPKHAK
jgi:hypothetical protein